MAWSTRQIADLAGTTVKTVRHYHKVGLLAEPERGTNGYKHYSVAHLTRLLRIRRLTDLGVSLPQIAAMGEADEHPEEALKVLDAELAATIERLQRIRGELAMMMQSQLPTDLPAELAPAMGGISDADRALMVVYGRVLDRDGLEALRQMMADHRRSPADVEFDELAADADESTRQNLAARLLPQVIDIHARYPNVLERQRSAPGSPHPLHTIGLAMADVYNDAQLDIIQRVGLELGRRDRATTSPGEKV